MNGKHQTNRVDIRRHRKTSVDIKMGRIRHRVSAEFRRRSGRDEPAVIGKTRRSADVADVAAPALRRARTSGRRSGGTVFGGCRRGARPASSRVVISVTSATAVSKGSTLTPDGRVMPLTLRTYWRAAASISSGVAAGCRPRSSVMFRHMTTTIG